MKNITNNNLTDVKVFRISTVSHSLSVLLRNQFKFLGSKGYNYFLLCYPDEVVEKQALFEQAYFLPTYLSRKVRPISDLTELVRIIYYVLKFKPNIVHTHSPKAGLIGMLAAKLTGVPVRIHTVAGLPLVEKEGLYKKLLINLEKLTYSCANKIIFNSPAQAQLALNNGWLSDEKVKIIGQGSSNGIDTSFFNSSPEVKLKVSTIKSDLKLDDNQQIISFVGRLARSKGINELVSAFLQLSLKRPQLKLVLVGMKDLTDPIDSETLEYIEMDPNIFWIDHQNDVRPYFEMADIFVFPSYREGFPQVIMQACSMSCAIVATDINGANEIIDHGDNGLLIPPKSAEGIVDACEKLLDNPELRTRFSERSRASIISGFDQAKFWNSLDRLYQSMLKL